MRGGGAAGLPSSMTLGGFSTCRVGAASTRGCAHDPLIPRCQSTPTEGPAPFQSPRRRPGRGCRSGTIHRAGSRVRGSGARSTSGSTNGSGRRPLSDAATPDRTSTRPPPTYVAHSALDGVLGGGVTYGNPTKASRDGSGAIDLACAIAADLESDVAFTAYARIPPFVRGFDQREWILGFTATAPNLVTAHPHIAVANTYLGPPAPPFPPVPPLVPPAVPVFVPPGKSP